MDRIPSANLLFTLITLFLLQGILSVQSRTLVSTDNQILQNIKQSKDASNIQNRIIAFLLAPNQDEEIELELANRMNELHKLEALRKELKLERQLIAEVMDRASSQPGKRSDACFWKYCV